MQQQDRDIINGLQGGFPITNRPFRDAATELGMEEDELMQRLQCMLEDGRLSRFGPLFNVDKMGGQFILCALQVPEEDFDHVAEMVNSFRQVAHNYERAHRLNMWFVLATESKTEQRGVIREIERLTGLELYPFPKLDEYFIGLKVEV